MGLISKPTWARFVGALPYVDLLPYPVVVVDDRGQIVRVNSHVAEVLGYQSAELLGEPVEMLVPESFRAAHQEHRSEYSKDAVPRPMGRGLQLTARKKDGSDLPVDIALSPVTIDGQPLVMAVIRDITTESALAEISRIAAASADPADLLANVRQPVERLIPFDRLAVTRLMPLNATSQIEYVCGIDIPGLTAGDVIPISTGFTELVLAAGSPAVVDVRQDQGPRQFFTNLLREAGINSVLVVPLNWKGEVIGALNFGSTRYGAYSKGHADLGVRIADQIAGQVATARLSQEVRSHAQERSLLARIGRIVSSSARIGDCYEELTAEIQHLLPWDRIVIAVIDRDSQTYRDAYWAGLEIGKWRPERPIRLAGTTTGAVYERGSPLVVNASTPEELASMFTPTRNSVGPGLCSALSLPLSAGNEIYGVLHLRSKRPHAYSEHSTQIAIQVAAQIAGSVANALLIDKLEREVAERDAIAAIGLIVNSELDLDRIYSVMADRLRDLTPYDRLVVSLTVTDSDEVEYVYVRGAQLEGVGGVGFRLVPSVRNAITKHLAVGGSIVAGPESVTGRVATAGLKSWVEVPFKSGQLEIGFLSLRSFAEDAYSTSDAEFLRRVAIQVAPAIVNARLVKDLVDSNRRLSQSEAQASAVLESASDAVIMAHQDGTIVAVNGATERTFLLSRAQAVGRNLLESLVTSSWRERCQAQFEAATGASSAREFEFRALREDGSEFAAEWSLSRFELEGSTRLVAFVRDISARKLAERNLEILATTDSLTGLLNRYQFGQMLDQVVRFAERRRTPGALVYMDLDNFKYVNDTYGHRVGDRLLECIGQKLKSSVRSSDIVARTGGDEFGIVLQDTGHDDSVRKARQLLDAVAASTVTTGGEQVHSTATAGIALFPVSDASGEDLLAFADIAMYRAKETGRSSVAVYRLEERARETVSAVQRVRYLITDSLANDRLVLFRQPIVRTSTGELAFCEILARLRDANGRLHLPAEFIPSAEDLDLIQSIDRAVIERSMGKSRQLADSGRPAKLAVNVSGRTICGEFVDFVIDRARFLRVPAESIHLELTETAALHGAGTRQCLLDISEAGIPIVIDDFGSGLTSFRQLHELPLAMLKLDGSLVRAAAERSSDRALLKAVIDFAHGLRLPVVAEHVENEDVLKTVADLEVEYSQGYLFGRPEPFE